MTTALVNPRKVENQAKARHFRGLEVGPDALDKPMKIETTRTSSPCLVTSWPFYHFHRITAPRVAYARSCVSLHAQCPALAPDSQAVGPDNGECRVFCSNLESARAMSCPST